MFYEGSQASLATQSTYALHYLHQEDNATVLVILITLNLSSNYLDIIS